MGKINSKRKGKVESWKDIPDYIGLYQVSDLGNVRSLPRATTKGVVLKQYVNRKNGYCYVSLSKNNNKKTKRVHVLIAEAFLGEKNKKIQVNHIDGNKKNNSIDNLEYCTQSENMKHAYATGLEQISGLEVIRLDDLKKYKTATDAAKDVSQGRAQGEMVSRVCRGDRSHYRGWHYAFISDYKTNSIPKYKGKYVRKESKSLWA